MPKHFPIAFILLLTLCSVTNAQPSQLSNKDKAIVAKRVCQLKATGKYTNRELNNVISRAAFQAPTDYSDSDFVNTSNESLTKMYVIFDNLDILKLTEKRCKFSG